MASPIDFDRPPIDEVVIGRTFLHRPDFLAPHHGLFWARVRKQLPIVQQTQPLITENEFWMADPSVMVPRVWYVSRDEATLVQVQQNRFFLNWRRKPTGTDYPRFPSMLAQSNEYWSHLDAVMTEVTSQSLQTIGGEITYVNYIEYPGANTSMDVAKLALRDFRWDDGQRFLPRPRGFQRSFSFALPDGPGTLDVVLQPAKNVKTNREAIKLDLTARGTLEPHMSYDAWIQSAHDFLVAAFKDMTTPTLHAHWGLKG